MGRLSEAEALVAAWRALEGNADSEGWRTIPIGTVQSCRLLAGRHFPGNEEAVLIGFPSIMGRAIGNLPEGSGFTVAVVDFPEGSDKHVWFALLRLDGGSLEIFTMMASDVIANLNVSGREGGQHMLDLFIGRIRAWQSFMQRGRDGVLGRDAEIGLYGELVVLTSILQSHIQPLEAVESWCGPFDAIHDFQMGTGAIEVKTTVARGSFPATVSSLEQLDDSLARPLFLAAVRLRLAEEGLTLPDQVTLVRNLLQAEPVALVAFEVRLLHAGFFSLMSAQYTRCFRHHETKVFPVDNGFPRLIRAGIPTEIRKARYEIDLDAVNIPDVPLIVALRTIGVPVNGT